MSSQNHSGLTLRLLDDSWPTLFLAKAGRKSIVLDEEEDDEDDVVDTPAKHCHRGDLTGLDLWPGSIILARVVAQNCEQLCRDGARVLDIGAGLGAVGGTLAILGAEVTFTDCDSHCLKILRRTVRANCFKRASVQHLDWNHSNDVSDTLLKQPYDIVVGADILYLGSHSRDYWAGLVETIAKACHKHTVVYIAHVMRDPITDVFFEQAKSMFNVCRVKLESNLIDGWPKCGLKQPAYEECQIFADGPKRHPLLVHRLTPTCFDDNRTESRCARSRSRSPYQHKLL